MSIQDEYQEVYESIQKPTNMPAIALFGHGNSLTPSFFGSEYMMYRSTMKPGASIVIHPSFPGILKWKFVEVFPRGYQGVNHCKMVNFICFRIVELNKADVILVETI